MKKGSKIIIDAGHGGNDPGGHSLGRPEKQLALELQGQLWKALAELGFMCMPTRVSDEYPTLQARYAYANQNGADAFVSLHCNASVSSAPQGPWTIYCAGSKAGEALATAVQTQLAQVAGPGRGLRHHVYPDASPQVGGRTLAVLRKTKMPAILVEAGFMTHPKEIGDLEDPAYQRRLMLAVALGVTSWTP